MSPSTAISHEPDNSPSTAIPMDSSPPKTGHHPASADLPSHGGTTRRRGVALASFNSPLPDIGMPVLLPALLLPPHFPGSQLPILTVNQNDHTLSLRDSEPTLQSSILSCNLLCSYPSPSRLQTPVMSSGCTTTLSSSAQKSGVMPSSTNIPQAPDFAMVTSP
ncbi:hypothetical protein OUZ56_016308 [Daphnia magna]|uniref:Uncharacterized protein n=1 Tax=Daphnia magna TaxID=35525 RepID=A0ABR0AQC8_9CRUS|nr:hypothetical protein OUZ56_016308 [Daphnia magna]